MDAAWNNDAVGDVADYHESSDGDGDISAREDGPSDEGTSAHSSDDYSSDDTSSGSGMAGDESENDSDDVSYSEDEDDDVYDGVDDSPENEDLCDEDHVHSDEGTPLRRSTRHRMIILLLSSLLAALVMNFGYQLFRLSRAEEVNVNAGVNDPSPATKNGHDLKSTTHKEKKASRTNDIHVKRNKMPNLEDHTDEYKMPHHPTRIYTHASLSSKNYRAGGVLSDEMLHRFEEDGVLVIRNLVSPKLLDRLDMASKMLIDGHDEKSKNKRRGKQFHMVKNGAIFLGIPQLKDDTTTCTTDGSSEYGACEFESEAEAGDSEDNVIMSSFRDMAMYTKIPRVAASLLRLDELRAGGEKYLKPNGKRSRRQRKENEQHQERGDDFVEDHAHVDDSVNLRICRDIFLTKDDDPYACGWHVDDTGFWPSLASDPGVNAWVALDDMPAPLSRTKQKDVSSERSDDKQSTPIATFALSLGSHRAPWRHEAYRVTGSTHTVPVEGYQSAADLIQRRTGSTCNVQTDAPDLYEKLQKNMVIYDLKRGDVIFHHRWVFHRTVTVAEYDKMANGNSAPEQVVGEEKSEPSAQSSKIFRRYSIRYAPGFATVPPGYGVELSVLHDHGNANQTLDEIVERSGPWYPKVWPHVLKTKPIQQSLENSSGQESEEEIEGITELVHKKMPEAEELQKKRKKEIQRLLSMYGGPK